MAGVQHRERSGRWAVTCTVELFGVARMVARTRELTLALPDGATFSHVYEALVERIPALTGSVITTDGRALVDGYACNVNGLDFVRDASTVVKHGDDIAIIASDAGG